MFWYGLGFHNLSISDELIDCFVYPAFAPNIKFNQFDFLKQIQEEVFVCVSDTQSEPHAEAWLPCTPTLQPCLADGKPLYTSLVFIVTESVEVCHNKGW